MLVLATFISICIAAVLFLLRFLYALQSEISSAPRHLGAFVDHISTYRVPFGDVAPAFALVHSNSGMALRGSQVLFDSRAKSQVKEA
jgi:hypothetical protein